MSTVYEAVHRNGARVAIKVLHPDLATSSRARERFLREGSLANAVGHPNAVRVLDDQEAADGSVLLVMDLLEGQTLRQRCERAGGTLDAAEVLAVADQVLDVLGSAHAHGIFHRDIKPANVFLTRDGAVKVLDFGVAAWRNEALQDAALSQSGAVLGTPAFMAPEQARGRQAHVDARTDLWALGATMFWCLTGRYVHEDAETPNEALIFAATQRAPPVAKSRPDLDADAAHVVDRALEIAPQDRWPCAVAMRDAIAIALRTPGPRKRLSSIPSALTAATLDDVRGGHDVLVPRWPAMWPVLGALAACAVAGSAATRVGVASLAASTDPPASVQVAVSAGTTSPTLAMPPTAPPPAATEATGLAVALPHPRVVPSNKNRRTRPMQASAPPPSDPARIPDAVLDRRK
jgi:serine/threonine-protein kinase